MYRFILVGLCVVLLSACTFKQNKPAPISDLRNEIAMQQGYHVVARGETLYIIAWRFGLDFNLLAELNNLKSPYALKQGQKLRLKGKTKYYDYKRALTKAKKEAQSRPSSSKSTKAQAKAKQPAFKPVSSWLRPSTGKIIKYFSYTGKGIDFEGKLGSPVRATAAGEVVYAGSGLRTYGNLLIIKHNAEFLSAYAHNQQLLVKEGQFVKAGQIIAKMGSTGTNRVMLHFELRKRGKPVNPMKYIK